MSTTEILGAIIVLLLGIIIGGTGGQALIRRAVGSTGQPDSETAKAVAETAKVASTTVATAMTLLGNHVNHLQVTIDKQSDILNGIQQEQMRLATAFEQFPGTCKLRHDSIDREQNRMQIEIDSLKR